MGAPCSDRLRSAGGGVMSTIVAAIGSHAIHRPNVTAIRYLGDGENVSEEISYFELDRRCRAGSAELLRLGLQGERIVVACNPGVDYAVTILACLYAGAVAVPLHPIRGRAIDRLQAIVSDCSPSAVVPDTPAAATS